MKPEEIQKIRFRWLSHIALASEYFSMYVSVNCVPEIFMNVYTPRDELGFALTRETRRFSIKGGKLMTKKKFFESYQGKLTETEK